MILSIAGAFTGAGLTAAGAYLLSKSRIDFAYYSIPVNMIVLGLIVIYAAAVGTDGVLYGGQGHMRTLVIVIFLALLGESWLLLRTSLEPITVERDLHTMWQNKYNDNRRQLLWYEHFYGCCGFKNATDMPSSKQCDDYAVLDYPAHGCLRLMRQDVFHHSKLALQWCLLAIV
ncbi:hypothetical protein LPJ66_000130, partial [Kickxella alabastrina]